MHQVAATFMFSPNVKAVMYRFTHGQIEQDRNWSTETAYKRPATFKIKHIVSNPNHTWLLTPGLAALIMSVCCYSSAEYYLILT